MQERLIDLSRRRNVVRAFDTDWVRCPDCERYLPVDAFPRSRNRPSGLHTYCLECNRNQQAVERAERGEDYREMRRRYRASESGQRAYGRYRKVHQLKARVHQIVQHAVSIGKLAKPEGCSECGKGGIIDGHHDDYGKPMEVRWLCRWCHQEWHRLNGEGKNATWISG